MASSRLELISKRLIKPSISTPAALRNYKLSITDQIMANIYMPMAFVYPNKSDSSSSHKSNVSTLLQNSLSKLLTSYYPFAGRLVPNNLDVDCNDMGATLIEARVNCKLSQISRHPNENARDFVFPSGFPWRTMHDQSLLVAQLTHFDCGGKALSLCLSHKLADGLTLCNLFRDWAAITRLPGDHRSALSPQLNVASIFPPIEDPSMKPESPVVGEAENIITKRYVFDATKLSQLKAKASYDAGIQNPTRVEVVTALLCKCVDAATSIVHPNSSKPLVLERPINIRSLIDPPLSSNSVGNLIYNLMVPFPNGLKDLSFAKVVSELRRTKVQFYEKMKGLPANEFLQYVINSAEHLRILEDGSDFDMYTCSSICRYPTYDTNFGWGNPESMRFGAFPIKNILVLMDDRHGDGVEAVISLQDEVIDTFERDTGLFQFASVASNKPYHGWLLSQSTT